MGQTEEVKKTVDNEATEFLGIRHTVLTGLNSGLVARDVDFAQQRFLTRQPWCVEVEGENVSGPVPVAEAEIQVVDVHVGGEDDVDCRVVGLEVATQPPDNAPDISDEPRVARAGYTDYHLLAVLVFAGRRAVFVCSDYLGHKRRPDHIRLGQTDHGDALDPLQAFFGFNQA
jgi:hypothetical protein